METLLLFVQQLEAEGLYAADDPPLVADELHAKVPHISRPRAENTKAHRDTQHPLTAGGDLHSINSFMHLIHKLDDYNQSTRDRNIMI